MDLFDLRNSVAYEESRLAKLLCRAPPPQRLKESLWIYVDQTW
jgi:hypothetical protein